MTATLKDWALKYADMGLAVHPLIPPRLGGDKPGKRPYLKGWQHLASTDPVQIEEWWSKWPDANIGIVTGVRYGGLVVIDLDIDEDTGKNGYEVLRDWQRIHGELPDTCQSITGRGGYHYLYRDSAEHKSKVDLYDGVDIRAEGTYFVAPPSLHENGRKYEWEQEPGEFEIAQADSRVVEFLKGSPKPEESETKYFKVPDTIPKGGRVSAMVALIGSLKSKGLDDEAVRAAVNAENEKKCIPPLTDQEMGKAVFPALTRGWKAVKPYTVVFDDGKFRAPQVKKTIRYTGADALMEAELPPVVHIVQGILTKGLGGLSAKSKLGKSWLALQLSVDVACGDKFLGFTTMQSGVLYIDLENTPALTQDRLRAILDGREPPANLYFAHDFNLMGEGFEEDLNAFLEGHSEVKLVIIDVFQKVKRGKQFNQTDYEADYEILTKLKQIADRFGICILPIYHDRKFVDPTDPFSNLLGSTAIIGVSDFVWVLYKEKREDKEATLAVTGRTIIDSSYKLRRNGVKWENLGDAAAVEEARKRREYAQDPVVNTIKQLLRQGRGKWRGRVKEIIEGSQYFKGCRIYGTSQKVGSQLKTRVEDMREYDEIYHHEVSKGNSGVIHVFESKNPFLKEIS